MTHTFEIKEEKLRRWFDLSVTLIMGGLNLVVVVNLTCIKQGDKGQIAIVKDNKADVLSVRGHWL